MKDLKMYEFLVCKPKSGKEFIKIITYIPDADGYVEIARIRMSDRDIVRNNISIEELAKELG